MSLNWIDYTFSREKLTVSTQRNGTIILLLSQILLKPLKLVGIAKTRTLDTGIMFECKEIKY